MALKGFPCLSSHAYIECNDIRKARGLPSQLRRRFWTLGSATTKAAHCWSPSDAVIKLHLSGFDQIHRSHGQSNRAQRTTQSSVKYVTGTVKAAQQENAATSSDWSCIVLDIEGTTSPISFVMEVLFPYARDNVQKHLTATYDSKETQVDIKLLRAQVIEDLEKGISGSQPIPSEDAGKEKVIGSLVANVDAMIRADRKITALKQLQGHIWRTGFENNELKGEFFEDVPNVLAKWHAMGIKIYIYSSGSREAQRLIFGNTAYGDLRKYLCGFFDTMVGNKRETQSYVEIWQSLGVDRPSQILFVTDVIQEAEAASAAGFDVIISIRPGNAPLPENHRFRTIHSFEEI
ncbi:unnamed protein product [Victoria cruziana]